MKEAMRQRLQTLARALTKNNKTKVLPGKGSTDLTTIYMQDYSEKLEIKPGIKCSRAEAWIATKGLCAHEAGHILYSSKKVLKKYILWHKKEHPRLPGFAARVFGIIEDARIERATALRYPETEKLFRFRNNYEYALVNDFGVGDGLTGFSNSLLSLAQIGDVPESLRDEEILDLLAKCRDHIERGRLGSNSQTAADAAKEVLKIVQPLLEKALEDLSEQDQPPATYEPQEAPSGDTSHRRQPKILEKRLKEKEKPDASSEPDDSRARTKTDSGSDEKPEDDTGKEDSAGTDDSEEKGSADDEAPLDDLPEEPGRPEESPDENDNESGDSEPSDTGGQETTEDGAPEASPEDDDLKDADDTPGEMDDEPADGDTEGPEESPDKDSGDCPEQEADDSPHDPDDDDGYPADDSEEDADDEDGSGSPDAFEGDSPDDAEDAAEGSGTGSGSDPDNGDDDQDDDLCEDLAPRPSAEPSGPDDAGHKEGSDIDDTSEMLRDAEEEMAAIDRRERDMADKAKEVSAKALSQDIKWDAWHHSMAFQSYRAAPGDVKSLKSQLAPLAKNLAKEIQPLLLPKNNAPHRGQNKGRVDARALYKYPSGDKNLFYKKAEPSESKDTAAYLLIDGSGSMSHDGNYAKAREAALLCHLALRNLRVVHAATLFTATNDRGVVIHEEIVRFSESLADSGDRFMAIRPASDNRDGYSIRIATRELLARPEKKKLLFVLSDGIPEHSYSNKAKQIESYTAMPAILDTRRAVLEATRSGVLVIGVHFGRAPSDAHSLMYKILVYSKTENLPAALGAAVRRAMK